MLYDLYSLDCGDYEDYGQFVGQDWLDVGKLWADFKTRYSPPAVRYPPHPGALPFGTFLSGCLMSGMTYQPLHETPELVTYQQECDRLRREWNAECARLLAECREKYPGERLQHMFASYLQKEHDFSPVAVVKVNLY